MFVYNLAEPNWITVQCDQQLLTNLLCIKDIMGENIMFNKSSNFQQNDHFCASNAILVNDKCYEFHWVSNVSGSEFENKYTDTHIMKFKHIFEAIALESKYTSVFVKNNISMLQTVTFVKHLDTVTFEKNIATKGYFIYTSKKYFIHLGSHTFKCFKGSNILFNYVCDGVLDCPSDASDEDIIMCNGSSDSKIDKTVVSRKDLIVCSTVYYMTKHGYCLKYTKNIFKTLNISHNLPEYKARISSKLAIFYKSEHNEHEDIHKKNISFAMHLAKNFRCLNPGE